jgi:TonB-dependent receptor
MARISRRSVWLLGAASAALGWGNGLGFAQEATPATADDAAAAVEQAPITVFGRRPLAESQAAALEIQRESDSIVSVLSADAIGNLPDQNIAFAIGRLPGVGIERDQGQARYVNLRGAPNYWTTLSFDGLQIVSPEGRATRFDNIPSALASQVIVTKAITPDLPGGTVAGNVNVITRSALDYDGFKATGKLGAGLVTLGGGEEIDSNIVISDTFLDGRLGILAQASYYRRNMVTDNQETDPYLSNTDASGLFFAREYENKFYRLTRENQSLSFRTDYEFDDANKVFWSNNWVNYTDEELRTNFIFRLDQGTAANGTAYTGAASGNGAQLGTSFGSRINVNTNSLESEEDVYTSTFGGENVAAGWDLSWRANYTYTADGRDAPALPTWQSPGTFTDRPTVVYNFTNPDNHNIQLFRTTGATGARTRGGAVSTVESFPVAFQAISRRTGGDETQAYSAKFDAGHEFDLMGRPFEFDTGLFFTERLKKSSEETFTATRAQLVAAGADIPEITASGPTAAWNGLFLNRSFLGEANPGYLFRYHSKSAFEAFALGLQRRGIATRTNTDANFWKVGETITAGYGMGNMTFDWGSIVAGVRVEKLENSGAAFLNPGTATQRLINTSSDETLVLPSAHLNWDLNDDMKVRVGLTTSASRPDFDDLRPNFTFSDPNQTVSGGNPNAKTEKQTGIDLYYEWYTQPEGFISVGVFYKDISEFLFTESTPFGSSVLDSGGVVRSGYTFTSIQNGGGGNLQGVELFAAQTAQDFVDQNSLPDWLGGFGTNLSATFTTSEVDLSAIAGSRAARTVSLPGTSDAVYNAQLTYEKYGLSARLAYQYRTDWIQSLGTTAFAADTGDVYWAADEEIDFSLRYQVNPNLEWFFDAANLNDAAAIRYRGRNIYPIERESFGARYITGVRFNF